MARWGGEQEDWLDLSTGINPAPYPLPPIPDASWATLPQKADMERLNRVAAQAYATPARVIPMNGAQGAIQLVPHLSEPGRARIIAPTYNEHAAALRACGWQVEEIDDVAALDGADLAVVVNPNNPDGLRMTPETLHQLSKRVGLLIIDESFADPEPELSYAPQLKADNIVVLRSFGKFYGLAGLRLGFALANGSVADRLAEMAGPWPVSGPAIAVAADALADQDWHSKTIVWLTAGAAKLDGLALQAGWDLIGGTVLFRTYATPDAKAVQEALARHRVWSRVFPYSDKWIRLGLPDQSQWTQLKSAIEVASCK